MMMRFGLLPLLCVIVLLSFVPVRAETASAWDVPNPDSLPDDAFGREARAGRDLIVKTSSLIGPDAADPAKRYAGNGLDCETCHLHAGTQRFGLPLAGVWGLFPQYIGRENEVRTLEERINGCMERSMNGRSLPIGGPEMKAMLTYLRFISDKERVGKAVDGRGTPALALPAGAVDIGHGAAVFAQVCAACHGADGQGQRLPTPQAQATGRRYLFPPLWGPDSYNDGAGMNRAITTAQFVHANMPFGATYEAPQLSVADAFDVAGFLAMQPRPHFAGVAKDYPDLRRKPVDTPYPPFLGPFTAEQHRLGPWPPIEAWLRANPAAGVAGD